MSKAALDVWEVPLHERGCCKDSSILDSCAVMLQQLHDCLAATCIPSSKKIQNCPVKQLIKKKIIAIPNIGPFSVFEYDYYIIQHCWLHGQCKPGQSGVGSMRPLGAGDIRAVTSSCFTSVYKVVGCLFSKNAEGFKLNTGYVCDRCCQMRCLIMPYSPCYAPSTADSRRGRKQ